MLRGTSDESTTPFRGMDFASRHLKRLIPEGCRNMQNVCYFPMLIVSLNPFPFPGLMAQIVCLLCFFGLKPFQPIQTIAGYRRWDRG